MDMYEKVIKKCREILDERRNIYNDQWRFFPVELLLASASYKSWRALMTKEKEKRLDDIVDAVNYLIFSYELTEETKQ
ncbi:MAG: hypothetical protein ACTSVA_00940 [Candidatus Njordarchaeales archaeon]